MKMNKRGYGECRLSSLARLMLFSFLLILTQNALTETGRSLHILLTNDDGYSKIGIRTMKQALERAGHQVTLVAPLSERSGSSAGITLETLPFKHISASEWAIDATPATCVLVALSTIMHEVPDLIISGTNIGNNTGPATPFSGTVGATIAAIYADITGMPESVPAIAFSTDAPVSKEIDPAGFERHFERVASFAVNLIAHLQSISKPLLPERVALNVNYPPRTPGEIKGVKISAQGKGFDFKLDFIEENTDGIQVFVPRFTEQAPPATEPQLSDVSAFNNGYITIVPIDGNYTANQQIQRQIKTRVKGLKP